MRRTVILKEYKDLVDKKITLNEFEKIAKNYGKKLEKKGWKLIPIEGGCCSPDFSTIYIYFRYPYHGQLLRFWRDESYDTICDEFLKTGDFIEED